VVAAEPSARVKPKANQRTSWVFSRPRQQYFWFCLASTILFLASLAGYQFTSPLTRLQFMMGWAIGLTFTGAMLSFSLILRDPVRRRLSRLRRT
jgi:hypothetical protein